MSGAVAAVCPMQARPAGLVATGSSVIVGHCEQDMRSNR
eukprot:CAMPEP_0177269922 /NCGR_PEP_ID=MMETSP0367-20130122/64654_1 /TAXON_ID=447022 ORGANISM="Scrippsiella hangoei-like, Strain SHHI-4" /NCGR_SAMPLE_ID=MMETSP0367 /ASSEMBLY_ACC=CAM_ASM_000362 /LENGTH=38 /DNA_ID= /DNA_START= /DNA_END= /DNA_ORIENTATION=